MGLALREEEREREVSSKCGWHRKRLGSWHAIVDQRILMIHGGHECRRQSIVSGRHGLKANRVGQVDEKIGALDAASQCLRCAVCSRAAALNCDVCNGNWLAC